MKILCVFGQHNYGQPVRGEGYEYANFLPTLHRLGHEVLFLESWNRSCYPDFKELNRSLLTVVDRERPDVVLSVMFSYEIWLETWEILRDSGIAATINWSTDDSWKYFQSSRLIGPAFHAFTTTYPDAYARYQRDGIPHVMLTQWAANAATMKPPLPGVECLYPVSFVGTAHGDRKGWIEFLRRRGVDVACFGYGWPNGPIAASEIPCIIRNSLISLNFANSANILEGILPRRTNQIKARTFEVPGAGGFLLTEWTDGLDCYYTPEKEIVVFQNLEELANKILYYLKHPGERDLIAWAGYNRTQKDHCYEQRLAGILDFALHQREVYFKSRAMQHANLIDWAKFDKAAQCHNVNRKLLTLRRLLIAACSRFLGPVRGPRAARRLVFELSWRLTGAHTYSAAGWPGRLFYRE